MDSKFLFKRLKLCDNGFATNCFSVDRGTRNGDPLFPHAIEVMACTIRQNSKIQSIKIKNEEVKFSLFADDMPCFLSNKSSYGQSSSS